MRFVLFIVLLVSSTRLWGQELISLPADFKENAYSHVSHLANFGTRGATLKGETATIQYIQEYFASLDLNTNIDTFDFQGYVATNMQVLVDNRPVNFKTVFFNPYKNPEGLSGGVYLFNRTSGYQSIAPDSITNHIVIAGERAAVYSLYKYKPKAIVILGDADIAGLDRMLQTCIIKSHGKVNTYKSYNIYSSLNNQEKEVLIGAHWDSFNGPGADDNASGVSVLLELARYFKDHKDNLPFNIKFVFFGAEELGLLGSQAYSQKHISDTSSVIYYFNVDCVGDTGAILADVNGGVTYKGPPTIFPGQLAATDLFDTKRQWYLSEELAYPEESNMPPWLKAIITQALESSDHKYTQINGIGSDHRSFALWGFVAAHIGMDGKNAQHCPEDTIGQVNKYSLELAGRIVASVVMKTAERQPNNGL